MKHHCERSNLSPFSRWFLHRYPCPDIRPHLQGSSHTQVRPSTSVQCVSDCREVSSGAVDRSGGIPSAKWCLLGCYRKYYLFSFIMFLVVSPFYIYWDSSLEKVVVCLSRSNNNNPILRILTCIIEQQAENLTGIIIFQKWFRIEITIINNWNWFIVLQYIYNLR